MVQIEDTTYKGGRGPSPEPSHTQHPDLELREINVCFTSYPIYCICNSSPNQYNLFICKLYQKISSFWTILMPRINATWSLHFQSATRFCLLTLFRVLSSIFFILALLHKWFRSSYFSCFRTALSNIVANSNKWLFKLIKIENN